MILPLLGLCQTVLSVYAAATGTELVLMDEAGKVQQRFDIKAKQVRWSPEGRWVATRDASGTLWLVDSRAKELKPSSIATDVVDFCWTRDNRLLYGSKSGGLQVVASTASPAPFYVAGSHPAASPDGTTASFTMRGVAGGLWVIGPDGTGARRLLKAMAGGSVGWSYDSEYLAAELDGHLRVCRRNGSEDRDLGAIETGDIRWSSGSAYLVAPKDGGWAVWTPLSNAWTPTAFDRNAQPRWIGPKRLLGLVKGSVKIVDFGRGSESTATELASVEDIDKVPGVYFGEPFPDPIHVMKRPPRGQMSHRGRVGYCDPIDGRIVISVKSSFDSTGRETVNGVPVEMRFTVDSSVRRRLTLLPDTDIWVLAAGTKVVDLKTPDMGDSVEAPKPTRAMRGPRATEYDGVSMDTVVVPMTYPIPGKHKFVDTFLAPRGGGTRRHHGNDLMAKKMTPLLAVFDGVVSFNRTKIPGAHNILSLVSDDGYLTFYMHVNNDTPGTEDGEGSFRYAFPADLQPGDRVRAGEIVAYCGDSGNAEDTGAHLHFELHDQDGGAVLDPAPSLRAAKKLAAPRYIDPDPAQKPRAGETRYDAVIVSIDQKKRTIAAEITAEGSGTKPLHRATSPRLVYFRVPDGTYFHYRGTKDLMYPLEAIQPGLHLTAVGAISNDSMKIRSASVALPFKN